MCHRKLLAKVECYGIRDPLLKCFNSYLIGGFQRVVLNGLYSNWKEVKSGIPQVSLLGPTLFFSYMLMTCQTLQLKLRWQCLLTIQSATNAMNHQMTLTPSKLT